MATFGTGYSHQSPNISEEGGLAHPISLKMELKIKEELKPEISFLYMKVLTLIKAKSNVSP